MKSFVIFFISFSLLLFGVASCKSNEGNNSEKSMSDTILVDAPDLYYVIPNPKTSIVASQGQLPKHVAMCVVDTQTNVSVMLLNLVANVSDSVGANRIVGMITSQNDAPDCMILEDQIRQTDFLNKQAWNFNHIIQLSNAMDTIMVTFYGYVFDNHAIVATKDTIAPHQFFDRYVLGLNRY